MTSRVAFVDHSFHRTTKCTDEIIQLLEAAADVTVFWDETWRGGRGVQLEALRQQGYSTIVCFQTMPPAHTIAGDSKIVLIPMHDAVHCLGRLDWMRYGEASFIVFCRHLHRRLLSVGLRSTYYQYAVPQPPAPPTAAGEGPVGFFWSRTSAIDWPRIKSLIGSTRFSRLVFRHAPDPAEQLPLPSEDDIERYRIQLVRGFLSREAYLSLVGESSIFFAPRLREGIGMAFLEAMALGKCVVAADQPTMNEYIVHGRNGLLYDPDRPAPLDLRDAAAMGSRARVDLTRLRSRWERDAPRFVADVLSPKRGRWLGRGLAGLAAAAGPVVRSWRDRSP